MKDKYKNLEILSIGNKTKTGLDCKVLLDREQVHGKWGITKIIWDANPDTAILVIKYYKDLETGEASLDDKGDIIDKELIIDYPIKKIKVDFKHLGIETNNTPRGTDFYIDGKKIKHPGVIDFHFEIGDAETITEYTMRSC